MSRFDVLTKYIAMIQSESIGKWIVDNENDGSPEHAIQIPFVRYSNIIDAFQEDLYKFCDEHPEYEHTRYNETLEKNCLEWNTESMQAADVSKLDAKCVIALLIGACRADRFCDGALLNFFESGCIINWLERLNNIE